MLPRSQSSEELIQSSPDDDVTSQWQAVSPQNAMAQGTINEGGLVERDVDFSQRWLGLNSCFWGDLKDMVSRD